MVLDLKNVTNPWEYKTNYIRTLLADEKHGNTTEIEGKIYIHFTQKQ